MRWRENAGFYLGREADRPGSNASLYTYAVENPVNSSDLCGVMRYPVYFSGPLQEGDCYGPDPDVPLESSFPEGYVFGLGQLAYAGLAK